MPLNVRGGGHLLDIMYAPRIVVNGTATTLDPPLDDILEACRLEEHGTEDTFNLWIENGGMSTDGGVHVYAEVIDFSRVDEFSCLMKTMMENFPRLKNLHFGRFHFTDKLRIHAKALQHILEYGKNLEYLGLHRLGVCGSQDDFDNLSAVAKTSTTLRSLNLSGSTPWHDHTTTAITSKALMQSFSNLPNLADLNLNILSPDELSTSSLEEFRALERLRIECLLLKEAAAETIKTFVDSAPISLHSLTIETGNTLSITDAKTFASIIQQNSSITDFQLYTLDDSWEEPIWEVFAEMTKASTHLQKLRCGMNSRTNWLDLDSPAGIGDHRVAIQFYILRNRIPQELHDTSAPHKRKLRRWIQSLSIQTEHMRADDWTVRPEHMEELKTSLIYSTIRKDPKLFIQLTIMPGQRLRWSKRLSKKRQRNSNSSHPDFGYSRPDGDNAVTLANQPSEAKKSKRGSLTLY